MFSTNGNKNSYSLSKELELLVSLPKNCVCTTCTSIRNTFKSTLGEKKFKEVCLTYGLTA